MDLKSFLAVFTAVFVAEMGDKTQLAAMLFSADGKTGRLTVFAAASLALIITTALGVLAGKFLGDNINQKYLSWGAGSLFIVMGIWTIVKAG